MKSKILTEEEAEDMNQIRESMGQIVEDKDDRTDDSRSDQYRYPYERRSIGIRRLANMLISKKNTGS